MKMKFIVTLLLALCILMMAISTIAAQGNDKATNPKDRMMFSARKLGLRMMGDSSCYDIACFTTDECNEVGCGVCVANLPWPPVPGRCFPPLK